MSRVSRWARSRWTVAAGVALVVFGWKLWLIHAAGSDLPMWDQWDAEGAFLYQPFLENRLQFGHLFAPHNEHRIFFTRVLALGLLLWNGQWDGLLQMVVNAALHAAFVGFVTAVVLRHLGRAAGILAALGLAALFSVPVAWENTLSGFQSQFYFLLIFAFLHLAGTALYSPRHVASWLAQLAGGASLVTMASGLGSPATALVLLLMRVLRERRDRAWLAALIAINVGWLVLGLWLRVEHPGHESLRASNGQEYVATLLRLLAWPNRAGAWSVIMVLPFLVLLARWWRRGSAFCTLLLGLGGWWLLQVLVLAYARANGVPDSVRYMDLFSIGVAVAGLAAIEFSFAPDTGRARFALRGLAAGWLFVVLWPLSRVPADMREGLVPMLQRENAAREANVRAEVARPDARFLALQPGSELPYPFQDRLAALLANPTLRKILPPSVRQPLALTPDPSATKGMMRIEPAFESDDDRLVVPSWGRPPESASGPAVFVSQELRAQTSRVVLQVNGSGGELRLETTSARPQVHPVSEAPRWQEWRPHTGRDRFRLHARAADGEWLVFTSPVEIGGPAFCARTLAAWYSLFVGAGGIVLLLGMVMRVVGHRAP